MQEELQMMKDRNACHLIKPPHNKQILRSRGVYAIKRDKNGNIVRYKMKLVAQWYRKINGESFDETFVPVIDFAIIRFFFSLLVSCLICSMMLKQPNYMQPLRRKYICISSKDSQKIMV